MIPSLPNEQAQPHAQAAERPRDEPCVLLKLGEIVLKGKNRQHFEGIALLGNIRAALRDTGIPPRTHAAAKEGVILLRVADGEEPRAGRLGGGRGPDRRRRVRGRLGHRHGGPVLRVAKHPCGGNRRGRWR